MTSTWEVQIADLSPQLMHQLVTENDSRGYFWIWGGIDHDLDCKNDHFSFSSNYFYDYEEDEEKIWDIAYELTSLFNGAIQLVAPGFGRARIFRIIKDGQILDYQPPKNLDLALGKPSKLNPTRAYQTHVSDIFKLIIIAINQKDINLILKMFEKEGSYVLYYQILETIETLEKKHGLKIEKNGKTRNHFTNTANNFSKSGLDSRHGLKDDDKNKNTTTPMPLTEAFYFISAYAKTYIEARAKQIT